MGAIATAHGAGPGTRRRTARGRAVRAIGLALALALSVPAAAVAASDGAPRPTDRLSTPYGTVEFLFERVSAHDLDGAARTLDLSHLSEGARASAGADLAGKLAYVLRQTGAVDWARLPDTPTAAGGQSGNEGGRRVVHIADLDAGGRAQPVNLRRVTTDAGEVWLFSATTVREIDRLYAGHGPSPVAEIMPFEARWRAIGTVAPWELATLGGLVAAGAGLGWSLRTGLRAVGRRRMRPAPLSRALVRNAWIVGAIAAALFVGVTATGLYLDDGWLSPIREITVFVVFVLGAWLCLRAVSGIVVSASSRVASADPESDRDARGLHTDIAVARRVMLIALVTVALGILLASFDILPNLSLSLLASTGAIGILVAVAARPLLGNMVAATEIAATKPLSIGDIVTMEGRWARVEDLTFSYAVLRTWSNTRLIVPYSRLLSEPFESWSREDDTVLRMVEMHVDYRADVAAIRREFHRLLEGDERWTGGTAWLVVAGLGEDTVRLEAWMSGADSYRSWMLQNDVRERLLAFAQSRAETLLPRSRHLVDPMPVASADEAGPGRSYPGGPARPSDDVERPARAQRPPPALADDPGDEKAGDGDPGDRREGSTDAAGEDRGG